MSNPAPAPSAKAGAYATDEAYFDEETGSAVSWAAILGGTFSAVALAMVLIGFGSGLGFASLSLMHHTIPGKPFTIMAAIWLIITQWLSSGLGGYLTGRLRTKWVGVHTHEVFFRDTAHGFITWAVTTVASTLIVLLIASSAMHGHMHAMHKAPEAVSADENPADAAVYYVDRLFRKGQPTTEGFDNAKLEAMPILLHAMKDGTLSEADRTYLSELVATHTGEDESVAEKRVDQAVTDMHQVAEQGEKTAASISIVTFLSMLIGAFVACVAAALGGHERDLPPPDIL